MHNNKFISPNFDKRPTDVVIDTIIIHHTKMKDDISALNRLCNKEDGVSAHYLINKQGEIFSLVPDHLRAWHAGASYWRGREKVNDFSIGIELDNNGEEEFSEPLMNSLIKLCHELMDIHPIDPFNIIGHSDIAPGRKDDPGRLFNWRLLADNKIGIMHLAAGIWIGDKDMRLHKDLKIEIETTKGKKFIKSIRYKI